MKSLGLQYLLPTLLGVFHISCSEEKQFSGQEIFVEVSPKITAYFADTDMSAQYPFPFSTFLDSELLLSHNVMRSSLDTLYFEGDTLKIKEGHYLEKDGPRRTEGINNLINTSYGLVLFNAKTIMIDKDGHSDVENFRLIESRLFEDNVFYGLAAGGVSYYLDLFYKGYDKQRACIYFFARDFKSKEFKLIKFDLEEKRFKEVPMWASVDLINAHEVEFKNVAKNHMPFIFIQNDKLVLSYNYSSEFSVIDLKSEKVEERNFPSNLFKLKKNPFKEISRNYELSDSEDFQKVMDLLDEWDKDVAFGNFEKLPKGKGFCRLVKSPQISEEAPVQLNMEFFDNYFKKTGEVNLTEKEPDLSTLFFLVGDRLFFKAKKQEDENYLDYYFVDVDF
ncbi:hypothetical protein [Mongoliibacter ruber]|uniref:DUF4221 domain-containing protein n=1 Tax=Mongoliibacter ruber TaxID=1750599 RepID=A0A2T0WBD5_9BACT|nr:hypothetical protein [Mongoliibacter ruber]PRY84012.1 hypothetical protein CLW00_1244 [Mongoliibacter ruber]